MSGPTLCGELTEWVGDGSLLNCCPEDPNEPFKDDFHTRRREEVEGFWVDPREGHLTEEEVAYYFGYYTDEECDSDEEDDDDGVVEFPRTTTMSLHRPFVRRHTQFHHESRDYMERMLSGPNDPYERFSAGSMSRLPLSRGRRYSRQH